MKRHIRGISQKSESLKLFERHEVDNVSEFRKQATLPDAHRTTSWLKSRSGATFLQKAEAVQRFCESTNSQEHTLSSDAGMYCSALSSKAQAAPCPNSSKIHRKNFDSATKLRQCHDTWMKPFQGTGLSIRLCPRDTRKREKGAAHNVHVATVSCNEGRAQLTTSMSQSYLSTVSK